METVSWDSFHPQVSARFGFSFLVTSLPLYANRGQKLPGLSVGRHVDLSLLSPSYMCISIIEEEYINILSRFWESHKKNGQTDWDPSSE